MSEAVKTWKSTLVTPLEPLSKKPHAQGWLMEDGKELLTKQGSVNSHLREHNLRW